MDSKHHCDWIQVTEEFNVANKSSPIVASSFWSYFEQIFRILFGRNIECKHVIQAVSWK